MPSYQNLSPKFTVSAKSVIFRKVLKEFVSVGVILHTHKQLKVNILHSTTDRLVGWLGFNRTFNTE